MNACSQKQTRVRTSIDLPFIRFSWFWREVCMRLLFVACSCCFGFLFAGDPQKETTIFFSSVQFIPCALTFYRLHWKRRWLYLSFLSGIRMHGAYTHRSTRSFFSTITIEKMNCWTKFVRYGYFIAILSNADFWL